MDTLKEEIEVKPINQEKQVRKIITVIGILLILLLIFMFYKNRPYDYKYNSFEVKQIKQGSFISYKVKIFANEQPIYLSTRYDPKSLEKENLSIEPNLKNKIVKQQAFITEDPDEKLKARATIAALEISNVLRYVYHTNINSALTKEYKNYPIVDCNNVNKTTSVIKLTLNNETKVFSENDCIILQGKTEEDLIKLADKLMFNLLGVME